MSTAEKFTSDDLARMPDDGKRYEIIEGELYVSRQPSYEHQYTCGRLFKVLDDWDGVAGLGRTLIAPGVIFAEDDDVVPDVAWVTIETLATGVNSAGHLVRAPELIVEVLSPGKSNEARDRQTKLKLYSRRGILEYWIVSWKRQLVEVYRRENAHLRLVATLLAPDIIESPQLPGFSCVVASLFLSSAK